MLVSSVCTSVVTPSVLLSQLFLLSTFRNCLKHSSSLTTCPILFSFFCFFLGGKGPVPPAYGGSQAMSPIGAIAAGLHHSHSNTRPSRFFDLHHSSWQCLILGPLCKARDGTHTLWFLVKFVSTAPQGELPLLSCSMVLVD